MQMKDRRIAATLDNLQAHLGAAYEELPPIARFVVWKQTQQACVVGITHRMQGFQIQLERFSPG